MSSPRKSEQVKKSAARRTGLGRGLGSLIPTAQVEDVESRGNPMDLLVPDLRQDSSNRGSRVRGGSARDLLNPRDQGTEKKVVSRETIGSGKTRSNVSRETKEPQSGLVTVPGATFGLLPTATIIPNPRQPRQVFQAIELEELADSLKEVGFLQPIVVRPIGGTDTDSPEVIAALAENPEARYELIMGERRLRAAELAGLLEVPAIVRETNDDDLLRDALLENLHRVQLNPLEEAAAYAQLLEDFGCTQETLATRIARSRSQIANTLRLLRLPVAIQQHVSAGTLSAGHARSLLSLDSPDDMEKVGQRIIEEGLSVRATEEIVRRIKTDPSDVAVTPVRREPSVFALSVGSQFSELLDTNVTIREGANKGRIVIDFADEDDLRRIADLIGKAF